MYKFYLLYREDGEKATEFSRIEIISHMMRNLFPNNIKFYQSNNEFGMILYKFKIIKL